MGRTNTRSSFQKLKRTRIFSWLEQLEDRSNPAYLFVDFGDNFDSGVLTTTQGAFRDVAAAQGTDNPILGTKLVDKSGFHSDAQMQIVQQTFTSEDRKMMLDVVRRDYLPFNITVVDLTATAQSTADGRSVAGAKTMADVIETLRSGNAASRDAYIFVGTFISGTGMDAKTYTGGGGKSPGNNPTFDERSDLTLGANNHDDVGVVYSSGGLTLNTLNNIAHEAGHCFGLQHSLTEETATEATNLIHQSEIMSYLNTSGTTSSMFSRYPVIRGDDNSPGFPSDNSESDIELTFDAVTRTITRVSGNFIDNNFIPNLQIVISNTVNNNGTYTIESVTSKVITLSASEVLTDETVSGVSILSKNTVNYSDLEARNTPANQVTPYDQFVNDSNIGSNPLCTFVSGTGANDIITITKSGETTASVTVQAFTTTTYDAGTEITVPGQTKTTFIYSIPLTRTILVYAGGGNDRIVVDGDLGVDVQIDGMNGWDSVIVRGKGAAAATYTPNEATATSVDYGIPSYSGMVAIGGNTISFVDFETSGSVTIDQVATVTINSPGGDDSLTLSQFDGQPQVSGSVSGGTSIVPLLLSNVNRLNVATGTGNDTLLVDVTGGNPIPAGGVSFLGGTGTDTIALFGDTDCTLTNATLALAGFGTIDLNSVENASFTGGVSANTFDLSGWTGTASVNGLGGSDTLIYRDVTSNWAITGLNAGTINTNVIQFYNFEHLTGGSGDDTFVFRNDGRIDGDVTGGGGTDTLQGDDQGGVFTVTGSGIGTLTGKIGGTFNTIENLVGGTGNDTFVFKNDGSISGYVSGGNLLDATGTDTLQGDDHGDTFTLTGLGSGTLTGKIGGSFYAIDNLIGGSGKDNFIFKNDGSITGNVTGGDGIDTLQGDDRGAVFTLTGAGIGTLADKIGGTFNTIENLIGGTGNDTFIFRNDGSIAGFLSGGDGVDTLQGNNLGNTFNVTGKGSGEVLLPRMSSNFDGIENLIGGSGNDTFAFRSGGSVAGTISGASGHDKLDFTATGSQALTLSTIGLIDGFNGSCDTGTPIGGSFTDINEILGGASSTTDSITGLKSNSIWTHTGNSGTYVDQVSGRTLTYSQFEVLNGGNQTDAFNIQQASGNALTANGNGGDDHFTLTDAAGAYSAPVSISGGSGTNNLVVNGSVSGSNIALTLLNSTGAGNVGGLGSSVGYDTLQHFAFDGHGGSNSFSWVDATSGAYGSALNPENGVIYRPTGAESGEVSATGLFPFVSFTNVNNAFSVNGGSGDKKDTLVVLAPSTSGMQSSFGELTTANGSDVITVSDSLVEITNVAAGTLRSVKLEQTGGAATYANLVVRGGSEAAPKGDIVLATPSRLLNILLDGMDPKSGNQGDRLTVTVTGSRSLVKSNDPTQGPSHVRIVQDSDGASIGFLHFENIDGVGANVAGTGVGTPAQIQVYDSTTGKLRFAVLQPFGGFTGGVTIATGDVNGDGVADIIVGAGPGGGPRVDVFDGADGSLIRSFLAYDAGFSGGVFVASGDVDGDGFAEIVVGAGAGGGPHVKVFDGATGAERITFFAYSESFTGGIRVAVGDVNGDGYADIILGAGIGGGPHVRVLNGLDCSEMYSFYAYDDGFQGGVFVSAGDLDGDGYADVVTGAGNGGGPRVRAFGLNSGIVLADFMVNDPHIPNASEEVPLETGISVAVVDLDGDGVEDILTGKGKGTKSILRGYRIALQPSPTSPVELVGLTQSLYNNTTGIPDGSGVFVGG